MINLIHGDCLQHLKSIEDGTVDFICADMPYGTTQCKWDSIIDLELLWPELWRVAKPSAAIVLFAQIPFSIKLGYSQLEYLRHEWVWEKPAATGFFNAKKMPLKAHENILVFYKELPTYNPVKSTGHARKTAGRKEIGSEVYGKGVKKTVYDSTERYPRSVVKFSSDRQKQNLHPTQKPEALLEYLVTTYTNEGETVLDFCMGSGTAGIAATKLDRNFIGIEKDEKYFSLASERLATLEDSAA